MSRNESFEAAVVGAALRHYADIFGLNNIRMKLDEFVDCNVKLWLDDENLPLDLTIWHELVVMLKNSISFILNRFEMNHELTIKIIKLFDMVEPQLVNFMENLIEEKVKQIKAVSDRFAETRQKLHGKEDSSSSSDDDGDKNLKDLIDMLKGKATKKLNLTSIHIRGHYDKEGVTRIIERLTKARDDLDEPDPEELCADCRTFHNEGIPHSNKEKNYDPIMEKFTKAIHEEIGKKMEMDKEEEINIEE